MKSNKKWLKEIDIIRAVAILLIVTCHLHFFVNLGQYQSLFIDLSIIISFIGLSLFFFVSGFSLYYNHDKFRSIKDLKGFYIKRVVRIFPLFWFNNFIFIIWNLFSNGYFMDAKVTYFSFIVSILGLQGFVTNFDQGFFGWFIGVILIYYFIYPLLVRSKNIINIFLAASIVLSIFILLNLKLNLMCTNFFMYYWSFVFGILVCWLINNLNLNLKMLRVIKKLKLKNVSLNIISLLIIFIILSLIDPSFQKAANFYSINKFYSINAEKLILYTIVIYFGAKISVHYLDKYYPKFFQTKIYDLIKKISFSTYAIYLFHGLFLIIFNTNLDKLHLNVAYQNFLIIIIGIPVALTLSYYIQKLELRLRIKLQEHNLKQYLTDFLERYKNREINQKFGGK